MSRPHQHSHFGPKVIISGVIIVLVSVFLITQATSFAGAFHIILSASPKLIAWSMLLVAGTYVAAATSYVALAQSPLIRFWPTFVVQIASGITNRLLPVGLGSVGVDTLYFKRHGFRLSKATAVVAANDVCGALGNFILLVVALIITPELTTSIQLPAVPIHVILIVLAVAVGLLIVLARRGNWVNKIKAFVNEMLRNLRHDLRPGKRTALGLLSNMVLTSLNGMILYLAVVSVGGHMFLPLTIAVLSLGAVLGAAVPTPGGLGGIEAGILAGLIACGVPAALALAATLIYRGLTYWAPIIPGLFVLPWVRKRYL